MSKAIRGILFLVLVVVIVLYAGGFFGGEKIEPGRAPAPEGRDTPAETASAERLTVPVHEFAVGTVESRLRVQVAAQVTARVLEVRVRVGATVKAGDLLIVLDERELAARLAQAREGLSAAQADRERARQSLARAEAVLHNAEASYARVRQLFQSGSATQEELDQVETGRRSAQAGVDDAQAAIEAAAARIDQMEQVVAEAKVALEHGRIAAPVDGVVAARRVEPGDLALPGKPLLDVLDPRALRLLAQVREGLIERVERGATLPVVLPALGRTVSGTVSEVIPSADPLSRTFRVRVDFEWFPGVYPGMFGRLRVPVGEREIVALPAAAVVRVGQLETVTVAVDDRWERRLVTTGLALDDGRLEVLSGLSGGETVGVEEPGR